MNKIINYQSWFYLISLFYYGSKLLLLQDFKIYIGNWFSEKKNMTYLHLNNN